MTAAHLGSFLNFAQLACTAKFKIGPKCAVVEVNPLTEVALAVRLTNCEMQFVTYFEFFDQSEYGLVLFYDLILKEPS